ncbi:MAG TPA: TlpA disulfide reductase family protein [Gammaproteobacteria bacterium]|nr:TlpA disulfide reductase family protein [Gammaproteobacteria bacterium]
MKPLLSLILLVTLASPALAETKLSDIENLPLMTDNGAISLKSMRGKTVYLDFWASWCAPCRKSFPWMNEMHGKYKHKGLVIVAVNVDNKKSDAMQFLSRIPTEFTIAYDPEEKLASSIGLKAMPSSFIIGPDGTIIDRHIGFREKMIPEYEESIRSALGLEAGAAGP